MEESADKFFQDTSEGATVKRRTSILWPALQKQGSRRSFQKVGFVRTRKGTCDPHGKEGTMEYESFTDQLERFMFPEDELSPADIIFIPGNGYPHMAEYAAKLYQEGYAPFILPSGRYSVTAGAFTGVLARKDLYSAPYETEWEFLCDVLKKNGVPENAILREDQATYTYENALFSRKVTDAASLTIKKAILCCKNYHARRALLYYQRTFPDVQFLVCPVSADGITRQNWRDTSQGIAAVTTELTHILHQFELIMPHA